MDPRRSIPTARRAYPTTPSPSDEGFRQLHDGDYLGFPDLVRLSPCGIRRPCRAHGGKMARSRGRHHLAVNHPRSLRRVIRESPGGGERISRIRRDHPHTRVPGDMPDEPRGPGIRELAHWTGAPPFAWPAKPNHTKTKMPPRPRRPPFRFFAPRGRAPKHSPPKRDSYTQRWTNDARSGGGTGLSWGLTYNGARRHQNGLPATRSDRCPTLCGSGTAPPLS